MTTVNGLQFKPLVSLKVDTMANSPNPLSNEIEAAFRIPGYRGIWLDARNWNKEAASFLAARSARTPKNLLNQVQRIMHHIQQKNSEGVYGALVDLYIVLENHGRPLRERMLKYARPLLKEVQYEGLNQLLNEDASALDTLPPANCSILSRGFSGTFRLVEKLNTTPESVQNNSGASIKQ